jgi:hypothetical protein
MNYVQIIPYFLEYPVHPIFQKQETEKNLLNSIYWNNNIYMLTTCKNNMDF